jgi:hypothetical protein
MYIRGHRELTSAHWQAFVGSYSSDVVPVRREAPSKKKPCLQSVAPGDENVQQLLDLRGKLPYTGSWSARWRASKLLALLPFSMHIAKKISYTPSIDLAFRCLLFCRCRSTLEALSCESLHWIVNGHSRSSQPTHAGTTRSTKNQTHINVIRTPTLKPFSSPAYMRSPSVLWKAAGKPALS